MGAQNVATPDAEKDGAVLGQQETDDMMKAIQLSKAEDVPLSGDGVVLLRLTRMARTPEVLDALLTSPALEECRNRVTEAGCQVAPHGACGPKFFVPCTEQQLEELVQVGFDLMDHHIIALSIDKKAIEQALQTVARTRRPRLSPAERCVKQAHRSHGCAAEQDEDPHGAEGEFECMVTVEHAFATDSSLAYPPAWAPHPTTD